MIIGITGTLGAGKTTVVNYLENHGFKHYSARAVLLEEMKSRGMEVDIHKMRDIANELRAEHGASVLAERMFDMAKAAGGDAIIESLRAVGEVEVLKQKGDFILLSVDADQKERYNRIYKRGSEIDELSYEEFVQAENNQMQNEDPAKQNIAKCIEMADVHLQNDGTMEELEAQVAEVLDKIKNGK